MDYMSIVTFYEGNEIITRKKVYVIDREAFYLICHLQESKPSQKTIDIIMDWLKDRKMAIQLDSNPVHLMFEMNNHGEEEEE